MVRRSPRLTLLVIASFLTVTLVAGPASLGTRVLVAVWRTIGFGFAGMVALAGLLGSLVWIAAVGTGLVLLVWALVERSPVTGSGAAPA